MRAMAFSLLQTFLPLIIAVTFLLSRTEQASSNGGTTTTTVKPFTTSTNCHCPSMASTSTATETLMTTEATYGIGATVNVTIVVSVFAVCFMMTGVVLVVVLSLRHRKLEAKKALEDAQEQENPTDLPATAVAVPDTLWGCRIV
uniref:Transmembrane protein n=1 Tax=Globodera pallida TaxID=36090 RepID=A0A183BI76_GLOPA